VIEPKSPTVLFHPSRALESGDLASPPRAGGERRPQWMGYLPMTRRSTIAAELGRSTKRRLPAITTTRPARGRELPPMQSDLVVLGEMASPFHRQLPLHDGAFRGEGASAVFREPSCPTVTRCVE